MIRLAILDINLAVELKLDVVGGFLGVGVAGESEGSGLEINFEGFIGNIGRRDR